MRLITILFLLPILAACQTMLPGQLYPIGTGQPLEFAIEKTRGGSASMTAFNQASGERFTGTYTAIRHGGEISLTYHRGRYAGERLSGSSTTFTPPTNATARGILHGDNGTVITLYMDIKPGFRPTGHGEGVDNHGARYQVQF